MNNATLQAKICSGYAKAAARLGSRYMRYRPRGAGAVLTPENMIGPVTAAFDVDPGFTFKAPSKYTNPIFYTLLDGNLVQPSDYLVGVDGTFFVAGMQSLVPILCLQCNVNLTISRPPGNTGHGAQPYGGLIPGADIPVIASWPASVLQGTKGEKGDTNLPGDVRMPWYAAKLPNLPGGALIKTADEVVDSTGARYKVSSAELTGLGWRLTLALTET